MEWGWRPDGEQENGTLTFGTFSIDLPTFKAAHALMESIDREVKNARIDATELLIRRINKMHHLQ